MSIHKKLQKVRVDLHAKELRKTGDNNGKMFFELGDFMPTAIVLMNDAGLCGVCSFDRDLASLTITDVDDGTCVTITIPMGTAKLPNAHDVQNIGACVSYERRYLWMTALDIIEHDGLDALSYSSEPAKARIAECQTLEELRSVFAEEFKAVGSNKDVQKEIIALKDKRKAELEKGTPA